MRLFITAPTANEGMRGFREMIALYALAPVSSLITKCSMHSRPLFACTLLLLFGTVARVAPIRMEDKGAAPRGEARGTIRQTEHSSLARHSELARVRSATVRMEIRDDRIFVPLRVVGPRGKSVVARFWVDSGGDIVVLSGLLAHELGLQPSGPVSVGMGQTPLQAVTKPQISIAGMGIDLTDVNVLASSSETSRDAFAGVDAEGFLPATVLKRYEVVFDYPARSFTLAQPGSITHRGTPVDIGVQPKTGFARVRVTVGRQTYGFMLDTGAAYTCVSRTLMDGWTAEHPFWPHSAGAVGAANMVGKEFDASNELLRIPEVRWGPFLLKDVGMVSRPAGVFEEAVSADMTEPIVGTLAGNVLRHFRIDLDYPAGIAYLESGRMLGDVDLDCVGLIVQVKGDGTVLVSGVSRKNGRPEITGVQAGDTLLRVDHHDVTGASLAAIHEYLSGTVGDQKRLTVRRGKQTFSISAVVTRHP